MSAVQLVFDEVFYEFPKLVRAGIRVDLGDESLTVVPVRCLPDEVVDALLKRHGPGVVYVSTESGMPPAVPIERVALLIIEERLRHGLPMKQSAACAGPVTWVVETSELAVEEQRRKKREAPDKREKDIDEILS